MAGNLEKLVYIALGMAIIAATASLAYLKLSEGQEVAIQRARNRGRAMADLRELEKAICAFKRTEGGYPATLNNLVPEFIPTTPVDPWNRPYIYRHVEGRWRLASYGKDGQAGKHPWFDYETLDIYLFLEGEKQPGTSPEAGDEEAPESLSAFPAAPCER